MKPTEKETIIHVITNLSGIGGAEMMLCRLIQQTTNQYNHVIVSLMGISEYYTPTLKYCQEYYALGWNGVNSFKTIFKLRRLINELNSEIIQCWMYHANVLTSLSVMGLNKKPHVFWGIHHSLASTKEESVSTKVALIFSRFLSRHPSGIIYCAHSSLKQHKNFGFDNSNMYVVANGVFLDKFTMNPNLHEPCVVGFAGRYHPAKGYSYLFSTIAGLRDQPIIFKIAGSGANLENIEIKNYFEQYKLDKEKVILLDQVDDMSKFYQSIDVFLMTSITEGFPNVLVEAMASGLPCISTDVGDAQYIIQDLGFIVPPRNVNALVESVLNYTQLAYNEKQILKQKNRLRIKENFSIDYVSQQYVRIWKNE